MTHKSEDYKISAVKYYLKNKDNLFTHFYYNIIFFRKIVKDFVQAVLHLNFLLLLHASLNANEDPQRSHL